MGFCCYYCGRLCVVCGVWCCFELLTLWFNVVWFPGCGIWIVCLLIVLLSTNFYFCVKAASGLLVCYVVAVACLFRWVVDLVFLFGFVCFLVVGLFALYVGGFCRGFLL